ncbi:hypothetical protein HYT24_02570 [Candidatus Pacearchaeota archaeon]|nr:hypothetical protein [Candidatus Pacearchaeota archaeon]
MTNKILLFLIIIFIIGFASATGESSSYSVGIYESAPGGGAAESGFYSLSNSAGAGTEANFESTAYKGDSDAVETDEESAASEEEETTTATSTTTTSGGGGGGGSSSSSEIVIPKVAKGFNVNPEQISTSLTQGEVMTETFRVTNKKGTQVEFTIKSQLEEGLIFIEESEFTLNPGESKEISVDFIAREDTKPTLYLGKIIVKGGGESAEILVAISVESKGALLDVRTEIPKKYHEILPGGELLANINMFNLGISKRADINLKYVISDFNGKVIFTKNETLAIETQTSFVTSIEIPPNVPYGKYVLYVEATYDGKVAGATANFEVVSEIVTQNEKIFIGIIIVLIMLLSAGIHFYIKERYPREKFKKKVDLKNLIKGK